MIQHVPDIPIKVPDDRRETFWPLLRCLLRNETTTPEQEIMEAERARKCCMWAVDRMKQLTDALDSTEHAMVGHVLKRFIGTKPNEAPSIRVLRRDVEESRQEDQQSYLTEYGEYLKRLPPGDKPVDAIDIKALFEDRVEARNKTTFKRVWEHIGIIAETGMRNDDRRKPDLKGIADADRYYRSNMRILNSDTALRGGDMNELADTLMDLYTQKEQDKENDKLSITTGIPMIDDIHGYGPKTLNLILGAAGQRKTAVARTIAYYSALSGHRTLFIPLEWSYEEELANFAMIHAHNYEFEGTGLMSTAKFNYADMTTEEKGFMARYLVPGLKRSLGSKLVIREIEDRTWPAIRALIESEDAKEPLELVVIDYIGLLDCSGARDQTAQMHTWIREIKTFCLHHGDNRGLILVSPVQGNRKGHEWAKDHDGAWLKEFIAQYNEMERSADTVLYCFFTPEMGGLNKIKLGFCKTRRHGLVEPQTVDIDPRVGLIGGSKQYTGQNAVASPQRRDHTQTEQFYGFLNTRWNPMQGKQHGKAHP